MSKFILLLALSLLAIVNAGLPSPMKVIYIDWEIINWNNPAQTVLDASNAGFNVIILAFWLSASGATDMAQAWAGVDQGTQQSTMQTIHNNGGIVLVSFGGSTDNPYGRDASTLGTNVANWAVQNNLDGVDFDLENIGGGFIINGMGSQQSIQWFVDITNAARNVLGSNRYISHAPQAPYFGPIGASNTWVGSYGGYTAVYQQANTIDFFNIQFYNQGSDCYVDYNGLFISSCSDYPSTSVGEIYKAGIPLNKIVVGKYTNPTEASNGWVDPGTLGGWFKTAPYGWNTGVMGWEWNNQAASWIQSIYP